MHNTVWVPGHFHTYLLLGMIAMFLGFLTYLTPRSNSIWAPTGFWLYAIGASIFILAFLTAGAASVPRRYAAHLPEWLSYDRIGSVGALLAVAGALILVFRFLLRVTSAAKQDVIA
jgi:cytochrome c oxidase subunit 1